MTRTYWYAALAVLGLSLLGCGGKTEGSATATTTAASRSSSASNTAQGAAAGAAAATALNSKFCGDWRQNAAKTPSVGRGAPAPAAGAGTPSANSLKDGMETTTAFMKAMAEGAPTELRPEDRKSTRLNSSH